MLTNRIKTLYKPSLLQKKNLFQWINIMFNKVDEERRELVGPDRLCAEWLLKNGAFVKWNSADFLTDYNKLPPENVKLRIVEVKAINASIMHYGFDHFDGCRNVRKAIFDKCYYLEDEALKGLIYLKDSLNYLQITECLNITESGLKHLCDLVNLKDLLLGNLPYVKNKPKIVAELKSCLPNCNVKYK